MVDIPALAPAGSPTPESQRLEALDLLRGVAVLGILAMNIRSFAMPVHAYENPAVAFGGRLGTDVVWWAQSLLFEGKMVSLFAMLFGAGALLYDRRMGSAARGLWLRRCAWLLLIGLVHAYLIWFGDILVAYALLGMGLVWWVRRLRPRRLVLMGVGSFAIFGVVWAIWSTQLAMNWETLPDAQRAGWDPTPEEITKDIELHRGGYFDILPMRAALAFLFQTKYFLLATMWMTGGLMMFGMALLRVGFLSGELARRTYARCAVAGYAVGLPLTLYAVAGQWMSGHEPRQIMWYSTWMAVGAPAMAIGHASVVLLLWKRGAMRSLSRALVATGRMALTNYLAHSVICTTLFYGQGFGLYARIDAVGQMGIVVAIWAVQLWWSPWWLARYQYGPAEWAWRSLTYWRRQPLRRVALAPAESVSLPPS